MSNLDNEELKATRELNKDKYKNCEIYEIERIRNNKILKQLEKVLGIEKEDKDMLIVFKEKIFEKTIKENIELKKQNKKKDKIIDEMAKYIACLDNDETICKKLYSGDLCEDKEIVCWECVKQYFERKVEEDVK